MELLAPAGNLEKLKWAAIYGADAVYFGTEFGSLRSFAGNFSLSDAAEGLDFLHSHGKKGYVTLNIYPYSSEYEKIRQTALALDEIGADALIVSDLGVLSELKKLRLKTPFHISTQANTTNYQAALAYRDLGAKRVNLARELSLERIREIRKNTTGKIEIEVFIHGAVCFSYSGRCAVSDYLAGHPANRGECKHPCRWNYHLVEETRPGQYMPVFEDERGLYLFNSKDLALFEYVPALAETGIDSIKIEGRMKSIHYIASVVSFYRQVLDGKKFPVEEGLGMLSRVPNRGYSKGFMKGDINAADYEWTRSSSESESTFVGNVTHEKIKGKYVLEIRNKIYGGEELEALCPDGTLKTVSMPRQLTTSEGQLTDFANHSQFILMEIDLEPYTILRRVEK